MNEITPHLTPYIFGNPSAPNNDRISSFVDGLDIQEVPDTTAIGPMFDPLYANYAPQGPENVLYEIRKQFPYLPIIGFPPSVRSVNLAAGVAKEVTIPDKMAIVRFRGDGNYWVCMEGNAEVPQAGSTNVIDEQSKSIFKPEDYFYFIAGKVSLSMISTAGCNVSAAFWPMNMFPKV